jgi:hypothetical protein
LNAVCTEIDKIQESSRWHASGRISQVIKNEDDGHNLFQIPGLLQNAESATILMVY